jgi:lysophospholipase L1-like esterase
MPSSFKGGFLRDDTTGALVISGGGSGRIDRRTLQALHARTYWPGPITLNLTDGVVTGQNAHWVVGPLDYDVTDLQWYYFNPGPNIIRITCGAETGVGSLIVPVYFNGVRSIVLPVGAGAWTDPVALDTKADPATGYFVHRTFIEVGAAVPGGAAGDKFVKHFRVNVPGEGQSNSNGETDQSIGARITAGKNNFAFGPMICRGLVKTTRPVVALVGDSIMEGMTDSMTISMFTGWGYAVRALSGTCHTINLALGGESASNGFIVITDAPKKARLKALSECTHMLESYGTNDFAGGRTHAQLAADRIAIAATCALRGIKMGVCTITPRLSLTGPQATQRATHNQWLRAGAPVDPVTLAAVAVGTPGALTTKVCTTNGAGGFTKTGSVAASHPFQVGVFDVCPVVETAQDSNVWVGGTTADDLHPNATGHAAIAATIDPSMFTL